MTKFLEDTPNPRLTTSVNDVGGKDKQQDVFSNCFTLKCTTSMSGVGKRYCSPFLTDGIVDNGDNLTAGNVDTGDQFATGVVSTSNRFTICVYDTCTMHMHVINVNVVYASVIDAGELNCLPQVSVDTGGQSNHEFGIPS